MGADGWLERFAPVDGDPSLGGARSFARLFERASGTPDSALLVAGSSAYLVLPAEPARLVHAADDVELLFGALAGAIPERAQGEWREIPAFVSTSLGATAVWVATTACLRARPPPAAGSRDGALDGASTSGP